MNKKVKAILDCYKFEHNDPDGMWTGIPRQQRGLNLPVMPTQDVDDL